MRDQVVIDKDGLTTLNIENSNELNILVKANVKAQLIITYHNELNLNKIISLEENAYLNLLHINECSSLSSDESYDLAQNSKLVCGYYELNDNTTTLKATFNLNGEESDVKVLTSVLTKGVRKSYDINCLHHTKYTYSKMENYAISHDNAHYIMQACGTIKKGCIKAKSFQSTKVLTTSDNQISEVTPLLLIDENDVMASHANSMGEMNEQHLYYLMSRGLTHEQATGLLTLSYLLPLADVIDDETWKENLTTKIRNQVGL